MKLSDYDYKVRGKIYYMFRLIENEDDILRISVGALIDLSDKLIDILSEALEKHNLHGFTFDYADNIRG